MSRTPMAPTDGAGWDLTGKAGIVTGAASGLGFQSARLLAQRGASVILADIDGPAVESAAARLRDEGLDVAALCSDVSDIPALRTVVREPLSQFGRLDFVHNNAGYLVSTTLLDVEQHDIDRMWAINVNGTFWMMRHAIEVMIELGTSGSIVNTASVLALRGDPVLPIYTATKHAVLGLSRAMAIDPAVARQGIRINCVCPGDMDTPLNDRYFDAQPDPAGARRELEEIYPGKRMAQPIEMATSVAFLVSDDAAFISGTTIVVDAGLIANVY